MSFMQEGDIPVKIRRVMIAESTLNKSANSLDIAVEVVNEDGTQSDWWRSNMSAEYTRIKNRQGQTCTQVTYENMVSLGYKGPDFSQWPNIQAPIDWNAVQAGFDALVGIVTSAHCARSTCGNYINIKWLGGGGGNTPVAVDLAALMGQAPSAQHQQTQQPQGGFGAPQGQPQGGFGNQGGTGQAPQGGFGQQSGFGG